MQADGILRIDLKNNKTALNNFIDYSIK